MTTNDDPSAAWTRVLSSIATHRSKLRTYGVLALIDAAEKGRVADGRLSFSDFSESFRSLVPPAEGKKAWMPFYYLSGRAGLWSLWLDEENADFGALAKKKPTSAASLKTRANYARITEDLFPEIGSAPCRKQLAEILRSSL